MDEHPEYHSLVAQVLSLYEEITSKALENEKCQYSCLIVIIAKVIAHVPSAEGEGWVERE